jgi:hypothetical protein
MIYKHIEQLRNQPIKGNLLKFISMARRLITADAARSQTYCCWRQSVSIRMVTNLFFASARATRKTNPVGWGFSKVYIKSKSPGLPADYFSWKPWRDRSGL